MSKIIITMAMMLALAACPESKFSRLIIYYLPLEAKFYVPPTPEFIRKHGLTFESSSDAVVRLVTNLNENDGEGASEDDYKRLRIIILNRATGQIVYITSEKVVLSTGKKYSIDSQMLDDALDAIMRSVKALGR